MKNTLKKIVCLTLALVMVLSLAACGKGASSGTGAGGSASGGKTATATPAPEFVYASEFEPLLKNSKEWINARSYSKDGLFYTKYEKIGEREHGDTAPHWEGEYDIYSTFLYFLLVL